MELEGSSISCGVHEIEQLDYCYWGEGDFVIEFKEAPQKAFKYFIDHIIGSEPNSAFMIFSDAVRCGNGRSLARYIRRYKLGSLKKSKIKRNPNSGNDIEMWIWDWDYKALMKHRKTLGD